MAGLFEKIADDVEKIAARMEDGLSILLGGDDATAQGGSASQEEASKKFEGVPLDSLTEEDLDQLSDEELTYLMQQEGSPLEGIADSVLGDIMQNQAVGPSTVKEQFQAFKSAITWSETFIQCLIAFQIVMFFVCLWACRKDRGLTARVSIMVFIGVVVRSAEFLNNFGARNWEKYCTQNYFDKKGIFVGIMLCAPLLLDCLIMLLMFVREAGQLLITVKREEVRRKKGKQSNKKKEKDSNAKSNKQKGGSGKKNN